MKKKIKKLNVDLIKRKNFLKIEIKKIIFRSIMQNLNVKPKIRAYAFNKIIKQNQNWSVSKQNNNICLKSGRFKSVLKKTQITRHEVKKLSLTGCLQNFKFKSW